MLNRKLFSIYSTAFFLFSTLCEAAPSKQDVNSVKMIFDSNAADDLAALAECGKPMLQTQYSQALHDAGMAAPRIDPKKMSALIRQIQRKAELLVSIHGDFNKKVPPTPEEFSQGCDFDVRQATKHLQTLDDFIFKS